MRWPICCTLLFAAQILFSAGVEHGWEAVSQNDFTSALQKVIDAAPNHYQPISTGSALDIRKIKNQRTSAEGSLVVLPGADSCFIKGTASDRAVRIGYYCEARYKSDDAARNGFQALGQLVKGTRQWLEKRETPTRYTFSGARAPTTVVVEVYKKTVTLLARDVTASWLNWNRLNSISDQQLSEGLQRLLIASRDNFSSVKGEYDIRSDKWPATYKLPGSPECILHADATDHTRFDYSCEYGMFGDRSQALDVLETLTNKIKHATGLGFAPISLPTNQNLENRALVFHDPQTGGSILVMMAEMNPGGPILVNVFVDAARAIDLAQTIAPVRSISPTQAGEAGAMLDKIQQGSFSPMPGVQLVSSSADSGSLLKIANNTPYALTVYISGPIDRTFVLAAGLSQQVSLVTGQYRLGARVPVSSILPFYGEQFFAAGTYAETFLLDLDEAWLVAAVPHHIVFLKYGPFHRKY